jgi:trehalose 6-phosphate synthase/phosphatase
VSFLQFSGAAQSLGAGAMLVNPWNIEEMSIAIRDALNMPEMERKERHNHNFSHVTHHTAQAWADTFVRWEIAFLEGYSIPSSNQLH